MEVQFDGAPEIFISDLGNPVPGEAFGDNDGEREALVFNCAEKRSSIANRVAIDQLFPGGWYLKVYGEKSAYSVVPDGKLISDVIQLDTEPNRNLGRVDFNILDFL
nr:hypothetical protein [Anaerotruncus colihominis]